MATSLKRINRFALGEARTHKKFFIIANIILGMGGLLYMFMTSVEKTSYGLEDISRTVRPQSYVYFNPSVLGVMLLVVGGGIGLIGAASVFRDMNSVQLGDVQLSLPMSANERYFSKLLALCYLHILPVIVWTGIPTIVVALRCAAVGFGDKIEHIEFLPLVFVSILAGTLFVDAVTVLCTSCCGALAESIYFTLITMTCLSAAPALIWYNLTVTCAGQAADPGKVFAAWTLSFVLTFDDNSQTIQPVMWLNCLISAVVMILTVFIYRRRDARSVGTPIANRIFFECVMFAGLMTVYGLFFFRAEAYIGIIIVAVIYIVIHIITSRGRLNAKTFGVWVGKFVLSTAVYIGFAGAAYVTGGFGMVEHLPMGNLSGVDFSINLFTDIEGGYVSISYDTAEGDEDDGVSDLSDEQVRKAARVFQKYAAQHRKSFDEFTKMLLNGYEYSREWSEFNGTMYITGQRTWDNGDTYSYRIMEQNVNLTPDEAEALDKELEALGVPERSYEKHIFDDEPEYYDGDYEDEVIYN